MLSYIINSNKARRLFIMAIIKVLYKEPESYFPKELLEELFSDSKEESEKDKESTENKTSAKKETEDDKKK